MTTASTARVTERPPRAPAGGEEPTESACSGRHLQQDLGGRARPGGGHDGREQIGDRGHGVRRGDDGSGALVGDAADRDEGDPGCARARVSLRQPGDAHDGVGVLLRRRREDRAERDVVGAQRQSHVELLEGVRGDANAEPGGDPPDALDRHVVLAHVDQIASGENGEIGAVVGDQPHTGAMTHRSEFAEQRERLAGGDVLGAELERDRSDRENGLRESEGVEVPLVERPRVDDRVKAMHRAREVADGSTPRQRDSASLDSETARRPFSRDALARSTDVLGAAASMASCPDGHATQTTLAEVILGRSSSGGGVTAITSPRASRSQAELLSLASRSSRMRRARPASVPDSPVSSPQTNASSFPFDRISPETTRRRAAPAGATRASASRSGPRCTTR